MEITMKAIEVMGTVDKECRLHIDEPLPIAGPNRVRVIILFPSEDIDESEWLRAAAANPAFEFLNDRAEDVYKPTDATRYIRDRFGTRCMPGRFCTNRVKGILYAPFTSSDDSDHLPYPA